LRSRKTSLPPARGTPPSTHRRSALALASLLLTASCGPGPQQPQAGPGIAEVLAHKARILWVAAHGDDESMGAGVLARACIKEQNACHFVVFTRDRGAECLLPEGCKPDMATVRFREMQRAVRLYGATLEEYDFFNAPLPVESFPSRTEIQQIWLKQGDPAAIVARAIRRFKPDLVITLDPYQGFTGHPEHKAAGRFTIDGIRKAADPNADDPVYATAPPHRIRHLYHVQNKYWIMSLVGDPYDPKPYHETVDSDVVCGVDPYGEERSCIDMGTMAILPHRSQFDDPVAVRSAAKFFDTAYLRRIDPFGAEADELIADLYGTPQTGGR
jgi:LmbE family N-acetylglucosaminyl deacetylase